MSMSPALRNRRLVIAAILLAALLVRAICAARTRCVSKDAAVHIEMAKAWAEGRRWEVLARQHHVFYPILLSLASRHDGDWIRAGQRLDLLASLLAIVPLMLLARRLGGDGAAAVAGLLYAVHPYSARYGADVLTEPFYSLFFVSGAAAGLAALQERRLYLFAAAGLFSGLAYLTRPEGMSILLVVSLWGFLSYTLERFAARGPRLVPPPVKSVSFAGWAARGGLLAGGFALCAGPYVLALHHVHGAWMLTPKKDMSQLLVEPPPPSTEATILFPESPTAESPPAANVGDKASPLAQPAPRASLAWHRLRSFLAPAAAFSKAMPDLFTPLVLLGILWRDWRRRGAASLIPSLAPWASTNGKNASEACSSKPAPGGSPPRPLFCAGELYILTYVVLFWAIFYRLHYAAGYLSGRHAYPIALLCLSFAAEACMKIGAWAARSNRRPRLSEIADRALSAMRIASRTDDDRHRLRTTFYRALVAALFAAAVLPKTLEEQKSKDLAEVRAGRWIAQDAAANAAPGRPPRVLNPGDPRIALYAGAESVDVVEACRKYKKPCTSPDEFPMLIPQLMRLAQADYFAFVAENLDRFLPGLLAKLDAGLAPELELVRSEPSEDPRTPHSVRIYRLRRGGEPPSDKIP